MWNHAFWTVPIWLVVLLCDFSFTSTLWLTCLRRPFRQHHACLCLHLHWSRSQCDRLCSRTLPHHQTWWYCSLEHVGRSLSSKHRRSMGKSYSTGTSRLQTTHGDEPAVVDTGADQRKSRKGWVQGCRNKTDQGALEMEQSRGNDQLVFWRGKSGWKTLARCLDWGMRRKSGRLQGTISSGSNQRVPRRRWSLTQGGVGQFEYRKEVGRLRHQGGLVLPFLASIIFSNSKSPFLRSIFSRIKHFSSSRVHS